MLDLLLGLTTSLPALIVTGGIGPAAVIGSAFGFIAGPWATIAKWGGKLLICSAIFIVGYRTADDHAAQKAAVDRLEGDNLRLQSQLGWQKLIATAASKEREKLRDEKASSDRKLADYEDLITKNPPKAGTDACAIDDADLRFRRSLRQNRR